MKRGNQQGAATLLITVLLTVSMLLLVMGSYQGIFYQVKLLQNHIKARQQLWRASGGLECAYAAIKSDPSKISQLTSATSSQLKQDCSAAAGLDDVTARVLGASRYLITATAGYQSDTQQLHIGSETRLGAIQSSADLKFIGSVAIFPDAAPTPDINGRYQCVAVRYKHKISYIPTVSTDKLQVNDPVTNGPFNGFVGGQCSSASKTVLSVSASTDTTPALFKQDFIQDGQVAPFYNFFGLPNTAANRAQLKAGFKQLYLPTIADGETCASKLQLAFTYSNKVWVNGHCLINQPLTVAGVNTLVVQNGLLASFGAVVFEGSVFHLVDMADVSFTPAAIASYWQASSQSAAVQSLLGSKTVYFDQGSFHPSGGLYFDADGGEAILKGAYNLQFMHSKSSRQLPKDVSWVAGSRYAQ
ncbi:hypothetical protein [Vibrio sp.]|uniref:hypothetical protein n=1 Tax=Vibrio sp. TaxID=678 RepID=UPI003D0B31A2